MLLLFLFPFFFQFESVNFAKISGWWFLLSRYSRMKSTLPFAFCHSVVLHGQVVLFKLKRRVFEVNDLCHSYGHSWTNAKCLALANIFTTTTEIHVFYNLYRLHMLHWQWVYLIPSILNWTAKQHSLLAKLCWLVPSLPSYLGWLLEVRILKRDSDCISFLCVYPIYGTVTLLIGPLIAVLFGLTAWGSNPQKGLRLYFFSLCLSYIWYRQGSVIQLVRRDWNASYWNTILKLKKKIA